MEKRLAKKCDDHLFDFKNNIKNWFDTNKSNVEGAQNTSDFLKFVYDFDGISITKDDFKKRKRVKSMIPQYERCCANRANGEQCTRRKQIGLNFCGTHQKGTPHGIVSNEINENPEQKKIEVFIKEIKGIHYYLDTNKNVYKTEDILSNKFDPAIIAHYTINSEGNYTIPQYNI